MVPLPTKKKLLNYGIPLGVLFDRELTFEHDFWSRSRNGRNMVKLESKLEIGDGSAIKLTSMAIYS